MSNYSKKYIKYKLKYNNLKIKQNILKGGSDYRFLRKFDSEEFNNSLYIVESIGGEIIIGTEFCIKIFNYDGTFLNKFGEQGRDDGKFQNIKGITSLSNGNIVVSDNKRVQMFDSNGTFLNKLIPDGPEQYFKPCEITRLTNGNIAVCDILNNCVQIFNSNGEYLSKFGSQGNGDGEFTVLNSITGLANGNIAVCDSSNHRVQIFNSDGTFISKFGSQGNGDGEFTVLNSITGLANGNIAVLDGDMQSPNIRVQIFNSDGQYLSKFGSKGDGLGQFDDPTGITELANGNIAVCDIGNKCVKLFISHDDVLGNLQTPPRIPQQNLQTPPRNLQTPPRNLQTPPRNLQTPPRNPQTPPINLQTPPMNLQTPPINSFPNINISSMGNYTISPIGNYNSPPSRNYNINSPGDYYSPSSNLMDQFYGVSNTIANTPANTLANTHDQMQMEIDVNYDLEFYSEFSLKKNENDNEIYDNSPGCMVELSNDKIGIIDNTTGQIKVVNLFGEIVKEFNIQYNVDEFMIFNNPPSITKTLSNQIAITDPDNNQIQILDPDGTFIRRFGSKGSNKFNVPISITTLTDGNLGIVDKYNNRVQIFNVDGTPIRNFSSDILPHYITQLSNNIISIKDDLMNVSMYDGKSNFLIKYALNDYIGSPNGNLIELSDKHIGILDPEKSICVFDKSGNFIKKLELHQDRQYIPNTKTNLSGYMIKLSDNKILVSNGYENTIQIYNLKISPNTIVPASIQDIITNINYNPYQPQPSINIDYLEIGKEKIFDFGENREFINLNDPNESANTVKIQINHDLFETLYQNKSILLTPYSKPFFIFSNVTTGKRDDGVDAGGLTRTVFTYLSKSLSKSIFFVKDPETNLFRLKTLTDKQLDQNENTDKLYFIGQLFGLAIKLNLIIQINLEPLLLYQLAHDIDLFNFNKELILNIINDYNSELLEHIPYLCFDVNPDTLISQKMNFGCLYDSSGQIIVDSEKLQTNRNKIIDPEEIDTVKNATVNRIIEEIKENKKVTGIFVKGFRSQINIKKTKINRLPLGLLDALMSGIVAKDYATLFKHLHFVNFTSIQRTHLEEILKNQICTNIQSKYIGLLLMVMTGSSSIPANGYPTNNQLRFEIVKFDNDKPADIHSCFNQFIINKQLFDKYASTGPSENPRKKDTELYNLFNIETLEELKLAFTAA
jgi:tripartite motif-containing protein 71